MNLKHLIHTPNAWIDVERGEWGSIDEAHFARGLSLTTRWFVLSLRFQSAPSGSPFKILYTQRRGA